MKFLGFVMPMCREDESTKVLVHIENFENFTGSLLHGIIIPNMSSKGNLYEI